MARPVIKTRIEGLEDVRKAFKEQPEIVRLGVIDGLKIIAALIHNRAAAKILKGAKSGRKYKRGSITHQASAPGEAPASDTGKLVGSGEYDVDEANLWAVVSFSAFYARLLEFGTRFIAPRPFIMPALDETKDQIVKILTKTIQAKLKGKNNGN